MNVWKLISGSIYGSTGGEQELCIVVDEEEDAMGAEAETREGRI